MKALLLIDIQKGLTKRKLHDFPLFVQTINHSINTFREAKDLIIFVQHNNKQLKYLTDDWKIDERIDKRDNDLTIQKSHGNAFLETDLESILREKNITEIVVCGLVSHGCVKATCLSGLQLGFQTALLRNGHTNWDKNAEIKKKLIETELLEKGVEIIDSQYVIKEITSDTLQSSDVLQLVWNVFEEFEAHQYSAEGVREFQNYIEYSSMKRLLDNSEMKMWGCFHNGKIIGMIAIKQPSHITLLFVDKQYHRQGIARALYQTIIDYFSKTEDCAEISVNSSLYAVEAYKRLGFVATDTEQEKNGIRFVPMKHKFRCYVQTADMQWDNEKQN